MAFKSLQVLCVEQAWWHLSTAVYRADIVGNLGSNIKIKIYKQFNSYSLVNSNYGLNIIITVYKQTLLWCLKADLISLHLKSARLHILGQKQTAEEGFSTISKTKTKIRFLGLASPPEERVIWTNRESLIETLEGSHTNSTSEIYLKTWGVLSTRKHFLILCSL